MEKELISMLTKRKKENKKIKLNMLNRAKQKGSYCPKSSGCCWNFWGRKKPKQELI